MTVYIFGEFNGEYTQSPNDATADVLRSLQENIKANVQIAIHRDGNLMYYCYVKQLGQGKYLGFCILVTNILVTNIKNLFSLFANVVGKMAAKGQLIHYTEDGSLATDTINLSDEPETVALVSDYLRSTFSASIKSAAKLPPVDFSVAKDTMVSFSNADETEEIIKASHTFGYTFIYRTKDYDSVQMNTYKGVLNKLNEENRRLREYNGELTEQNTKLRKQKARRKTVAILSFLLAGCCAAFSVLLWNVSESDRINAEELARAYVDKNYAQLEIARLQDINNWPPNTIAPFVVKKCELGATQLEIDYFAPKTRNINIMIQFFYLYGSYVRLRETHHLITVERGDNSLTIPFVEDLDDHFDYAAVIYDGRIMASARW